VSDQIHLAIGASPWQPSPDSELVEEYSHYDMPTAGVISQSGCLFLFECLEGIVLDVSIWIYAPILEREEEALSHLSGNPLSEAMDEIWRSRDVAVVLVSADAIQSGGTVTRDTIARWGIRRAALKEIQSLLDRERLMAGTLKEAAG